MYAQHFGLKQEPFSIAPDPRYLFMSERHREALAHLLYGVGSGGGFVLLTGEIGAGKTTVCRCFLEQIPRRCNVAYIFNPKLTVIELLQSICHEFRIPLPEGIGQHRPATVKDYVDPLNEFLLKTHAVGQNNVLIIDEAQNLSADVLEQLRLLTNLETSERKLLQIVLIGQPELRDMLARPELEQLAQRVIARYHLDALSEAETAQYILHRLAVAGKTHGHLFDAKAVRRIHHWTRGVPRRINLLCDRALLGAYALGKEVVNRTIVDQAAHEVFERPAPKAEAPRRAPSAGKHSSTSAPHTPVDPPARAVASRRPLTWAWALLVGVALPTVAALTLWGRQGGALSFPGLQASARVASAPGQSAAAGSAARPASAASSTASDAPTAMLDATALAQALRAAKQPDTAAWRELAALWGENLGGGDPCQAAGSRQLQCFRHNGGLALVRQLDRPGVLALHEGQRNVDVLLTALSRDSATLQIDGTRHQVSLAALSSVWRGEFTTLWRTPEGYRRKLLMGDSGPAVDWLSARMASVQGEALPTGTTRFDQALKARVQAFQLAQGLTPDGVAGATTLMLLNRQTGVPEPQLGQAPATPAPSSTGT